MIGSIEKKAGKRKKINGWVRYLAASCAIIAAAGPVDAKTLRWGAPREIGSLDPYAIGDTFTLSFVNHIYEGLARQNRDLKLEPALAESWEIISPTVWRFKLRQGVKFHNGNPFTADDVVASLDRVADAGSPMRTNLPAYKSSKKIDDFTVDVELNSPDPLLVNELSSIFIMDKEWMEANNSLQPTSVGGGVKGYSTENANGTGPFMVESRRPDSKTVLVKNPKWWDTPQHNIDQIDFTPITSSATRVAAMLSGEIDFTNVAPLQDIGRLAASQEVKVLGATELRTVYFGFNMRDSLFESDVLGKNPFKDLKVRDAMYRAIDIDAVQKRAMRGLSRNTGAIVAPAVNGYEKWLDGRPLFDLAAAKKLLAEAGYPNGFSFRMSCQTDGLINEEEFCQAVASSWSRIGLRPNLTFLPRAQEVPKRAKGEFDIIPAGWSNDPEIDAYSILGQVVHSRVGSSGGFNYGNWGDPRVDAIVDKAAVELDPTKRTALLTQALELVKSEILLIPMHQQPMVWAIRNTISTMVQTPDNRVKLWLATMK